MTKQKGQAFVEFALIFPFFVIMVFGMIYGGILFMDYLQLNNAAREVARDISVSETDSNRENLKINFENRSGDRYKRLTKLYADNPKINIESNKVTVTIELNLNEEGVPIVLRKINFPPKQIKPIKVVMPLENSSNKEN